MRNTNIPFRWLLFLVGIIAYWISYEMAIVVLIIGVLLPYLLRRKPVREEKFDVEKENFESLTGDNTK